MTLRFKILTFKYVRSRARLYYIEYFYLMLS